MKEECDLINTEDTQNFKNPSGWHMYSAGQAVNVVQNKEKLLQWIPRVWLDFQLHTYCTSYSAFNISFHHAGIKVTMIIVLGCVLRVGGVAAAELFHMQQHCCLVSAELVTVKLMLKHFQYSKWIPCHVSLLSRSPLQKLCHYTFLYGWCIFKDVTCYWLITSSEYFITI